MARFLLGAQAFFLWECFHPGKVPICANSLKFIYNEWPDSSIKQKDAPWARFKGILLKHTHLRGLIPFQGVSVN